MSLQTLIKLIPPSLPADYCFVSFQKLAVDLFSGAVVLFQSDVGNSFYNYGPTTPSADNQGFPWLRTVGGNPDSWYIYVNGLWIWPFHVAADANEGKIWYGSEAALWASEGGSGTDPSIAGNVSTTTGSFWEKHPGLNGRSPMGIGDIPESTPAKNLAVGESYGAGSHMQSAQEVGPHTHTLTPKNRMESTGSGDIDGIYVAGTGPDVGELSAASNTFTTTQQKMPIIHPVYGVIFARRTNRAFKTA